jgi:ABC-type glycerol-3-phosphate transport system substrate-binding protein
MRRTLLVLILVLAGCGGGEAATLDGYATYDSSQASFAPQVEFRVTALEGTEWDSFVDQSRTVTKTLIEQYEGKLTDYDAEIDGAKEVSGAEVNYTATDGKPYRALTVDALLDDGKTVVALTAGGRAEDKIDLEGVVKSLKLK